MNNSLNYHQASYPWGTSCLLLDDKASIVTQTCEKCSEDSLTISNGKYSVRGCDQRILMYQTTPVDLASEFIKCSSFTPSEGGCDHWVAEGSFVCVSQ